VPDRGEAAIVTVTTDVGLVPPATSALREGSHVQAVLDAGGSPTRVAEEVAWRRLGRAGVMLTTTNAIVSELVRDWSSPAGRAAFGLLMA